jgi:hypothetical protein
MSVHTTYHILATDGERTTRTVEWPRDPGYDRIKALIEPILGAGNWLEHVAVLHEGQRRDMFVDENGHSKRLPRNEVATEIYRSNWLTQHPGVDPEELPHIVGPAVLFPDRLVWF